MRKLEDYQNPFDAIFEFEQAVADYTGAPYCVTTDCCTHAIEIAFRLAHTGNQVSFPSRTYLSVPMTMHKLNVPYQLIDIQWTDYYEFEGSRVWDCARYFKENMYVSGSIQCVSFGRTKPLEIGQGGCILTDNADLYREASLMRYDGRDLRISPWITQKTFSVGYHYYMRPEECITGLNLLEAGAITKQQPHHFNYPDCKDIEIK